MPAVDTNVLVRLIVRDDARQAANADRFVSSGAWVSHLALAETMWVLSSAYGLGAARIAAAVEMLLEHKELVVQDRQVVAAALSAFRAKPEIGFSDCLLVEIARAAGQSPLGTFDRELSRLDGAVGI